MNLCHNNHLEFGSFDVKTEQINGPISDRLDQGVEWETLSLDRPTFDPINCV